MTDPLQRVLREIDEHVDAGGWDQRARLYALVPTTDLLEREPGLAETLGVSGEADAFLLTPVEQELPPDQLEEVLETIEWPDAVRGCAVVLERLVLPPSAEQGLPADEVEATEYARTHPERQEVRITAGALRDGSAYSLLRLRARDEEPVGGEDLVPGLLRLLAATLEEMPGEAGNR